ncbi:BA14K family protein [Rhizobium grahamii]
MPGLHNLYLIALFSLLPCAALAMPLTGLSPHADESDVIRVGSTMCDARGCFTFGPVQSFRPSYVQPNFRPPTAAGPTYYRPGAQGRGPLYYNPPPPVRTVQPKTQDRQFHVDWCRTQYRTYNPKTDRFVTYEGFYKTCNSPYD